MRSISVLANSSSGDDDLADDAQYLGGVFAEKNYSVVLPGRLDGIKGAFASGMISFRPHEKTNLFNVTADPATLPESSKALNEVERIVQEQNHRVIVNGAENVKASLVRRSDIAVLLPGGGAEDLNQAVHLARTGIPLIVVNDSGYYSGFKKQIEKIKENSFRHGLRADETGHIHFVDDVSRAASLVQVYERSGTPEHDYMQRRADELSDERILRHSREGHLTAFKTIGNVHILSAESGLAALDRGTAVLVEYNALPLVIDNAKGYHNGLLEQLENFAEEGAEHPGFHERYVVAKNAAHAADIARDIDTSSHLSGPEI